MRILAHDLRFTFRSLAHSPGFAAAAILLLALGIGANTALFTLTDAVLLRPLPVPDPGRLALFRWYSGPDLLPQSIAGYLDMAGEGGEATSTSFSYPAFEAMREAGRDVVDAAAFGEVESLHLRIEGAAEVASAQLVSGNFFTALGVPPARGRAVTPDDDREGTPAAVAVAGHRFWERRLGGDAGVLGRTIHLNGQPFTLVGVAPPEFRGTLQVGHEPDLYLPLAAQPLVSPDGSLLREGGTWWVQILGRLRPGTTAGAARGPLDAAFRETASLGIEAAAADRDLPRLALEDGSRGQPEVRRDYVRPLLVLSGMAALVLVIACANVANLLLARGAARRREVAVRAALGAGRGRLVRQLLTESLVLGLLGGASGLALAAWGGDAAASLLPAPAPPGGLRVAPDLRTFGFTLAVSLAVGALFGLAPALRAARVQPVEDLKAGAAPGGGRRLGLGGVLVGAQVAVSLVLLFGAALFFRTLRNLQDVDPGFAVENLLVFKVEPSLIGYKGERLLDLYGRIAAGLEALPGVRSVTFSRNGLLEGSASVTRTAPFGREADPEADGFTWMHLARSNFLPAMGIPLLRGRGLEPADERAARSVAVVNESLARRLFGEEEALGRQFVITASNEAAPIEIVGVARDAHYDWLRRDPPPTFYTPFTRKAEMAGEMTFAVRAAADPMVLLPAVRAAVAAAEPDLPVFEARTMEAQARRSILRERQFAVLATGFGAVALLLACIGLYGVLSYAARRRRREIGIRLALGAAPAGVLRTMLRQALLPAACGCAAGLAGALAAARLVRGMLFGIAPSDPIALALVTAVLLAVALLAAWLPARRAARTDPVAVLRYE